MKIENDKLIIDDCVIGDEEYVLSQFEKAIKYLEKYLVFFNILGRNQSFSQKTAFSRFKNYVIYDMIILVGT